MESYTEIREAVAKLCAGFPGPYWRALDREMAYPTAFVNALTESGRPEPPYASGISTDR